MTLRRPCSRCSEYFYPTGKACKLCEKCKLEKRKELTEKLRNEKIEKIKNRRKKYFFNKEVLNKLVDDITLKKWKILSTNYKLGKLIWGSGFTRERLAYDMEMPYTTVLRCLALDKINERNWDLQKQGKISVYKLAMIASLRNHRFQDKIVDIVIEDKLSTYQIKTLKIRNVKDINVERHRLAIENGYSRKSSAYKNFKSWIERGERFMELKPEKLPSERIIELKNHLNLLEEKIKKYIKELSL